MQNSTIILIFSNCACVKPFQHKSELGNIFMMKARNCFFLGVEYSSEAWPLMVCKFMLIYANEKINDIYFPERGRIDKAQFILDRSGLGLKTCKIPTASLNRKMLCLFSLSFSEAVHAYSLYTKNFKISR